MDTGWRKENANQNRKGFGQDLREPQAGDRANRFSAACGLDAQRTQIFLPVMLSAFSAVLVQAEKGTPTALIKLQGSMPECFSA